MSDVDDRGPRPDDEEPPRSEWPAADLPGSSSDPDPSSADDWPWPRRDTPRAEDDDDWRPAEPWRDDPSWNDPPSDITWNRDPEPFWAREPELPEPAASPSWERDEATPPPTAPEPWWAPEPEPQPEPEPEPQAEPEPKQQPDDTSRVEAPAPVPPPAAAPDVAREPADDAAAPAATVAGAAGAGLAGAAEAAKAVEAPGKDEAAIASTAGGGGESAPASEPSRPAVPAPAEATPSDVSAPAVPAAPTAQPPSVSGAEPSVRPAAVPVSRAPTSVPPAEPAVPAEPSVPPAEPSVAPVDPWASPAGQDVPLTEAGRPRMSWDRRRLGERRKPTTSEQAVPWLIGIVLALAGIVLVLLALIYTSENGRLASVNGSPSARASGLISPSGGSVAASPSGSSTTAPTPTPSPSTAAVTYGALEMIYLSRTTASSPVYLYRRDFSVSEEAETLARADQGVEQFAWAPDGRTGAGLISGRVLALQPGRAARALVDGMVEIAFSPDSTTVYAVRVTRGGANDTADIIAVDWTSGKQRAVSSVTYPHPAVAPDAALKEAQFVDDGGLVRLYPAVDDRLVLWILGAPSTYVVSAAGGKMAPISGPPTLYSPDEQWRVKLKEASGTTTLTLVDRAGATRATTTAAGLVSHVRWAPNGSEVSFTLGHTGKNGGVVQNLFVWELVDGKAPKPVTSNGTSFGAEWRGAPMRWVNEPAA